MANLDFFVSGISIFYEFEETYILAGGVEKGVENYNNLILVKAIKLKNVEPPDIGKFIGENSSSPEIANLYKLEKAPSPSIWISKDKFLGSFLRIEEDYQVDFDDKNKADLPSVDNLYKVLMQKNRLLVLENPVPEFITQRQGTLVKALKILLWGIGENLYTDSDCDLDFGSIEFSAERRGFYETLAHW